MCILGIFMAAMGPLSQKVIAQEVPENCRGHSFGILHFFQSFGRVISLTITTSVSGLKLSSIKGWRHALAGFGLASIIVGIILGSRVTDCPHQRRRQKEKGRWFSLRDTAYVFSNGSVWVMLIMGVLNGVPRSAIHFSTMYFQYCGIPDWWASFIVSSSWIAAMVVAPVIGYTGDIVHSRYPNHGRQCLAQVCIVARCILMTVMLTCVPREAQSVLIFVLLAILIGFLAGWPGVGVNRPILTEIVNPEHRATTFALVSCLEGVGAAALGAPIVGFLCENVFGYVKVMPSAPPHTPSRALQLGNARAIALSMLCMTVGPWLLTLVAYGFLHLTYKIDSRHGSVSAGRGEALSSPLSRQAQNGEALPLVA
ncbi:Os09g0371300 protein, related [Eimeria praecox]|uniref:Os09g0371300 protein, related n=1 Tax=Eimeria praecox TaxID=51316 RepID=U6GVT7_9EIME|nr:Os09g0371300 protein, related [Eimeria praecox]